MSNYVSYGTDECSAVAFSSFYLPVKLFDYLFSWSLAMGAALETNSATFDGQIDIFVLVL